MGSNRAKSVKYQAIGLACALFLAVSLTAFVAKQAVAQVGPHPVSRVLLIYENESTLTAAVEVAQGLRASMSKAMPADIEIYSEYLDTVRFPSPANVARLTDYLTSKYQGMTFDVILTIGPGALKFALDHRTAIGGGAPIVFGAVTDNSIRNNNLPADVKGVVSHFDVGKTIGLALTLQPDTKQIVVVTGSSAFDKSWQVSARATLRDAYSGVPVTYLSNLPIKGFMDAARNAADQTIFLVLTIFEDADGRKFIPRDAAGKIAAVARVPVYSVYSSYFGAGATAGYVGTFQAVGEQMGSLAARVLKGDLNASQTSFVGDGPLVDWLQVRHFGIDPERIPRNAEIVNFQPSVWERYRPQILAILAVIVLQTATIVALFFERRRKVRLQAELNLERLELAYISRTAQLGELSGALAHELNQPLTSILANAESGRRLLDSDPLDSGELREILGDIVLDNRRASTVIIQLRRLMIRGETSLASMDLNHAATTTLALLRSELLARQTQVDLALDLPDVRIQGNLPQLQQVILNLVLNAADAMRHLPPAKRIIAIETRKRENGTLELTVTDLGVGIAPERVADLFKPFVSTKKASLGLGLAICKSIVQAHGGNLRFDDSVRQGARVILTLPAA
ncbi:ABC transporter substrate binding protein [Rhizobium sp. NZLR3b]|uniref:sensor histidine kinase n=1 Tax=Rhizobium sp. NZLR3b TaxID=2731101 RepID=UPI00287F5381|nr:ABC transporter substrate binding protein [Rhizobium sp. NZLR3b]